MGEIPFDGNRRQVKLAILQLISRLTGDSQTDPNARSVFYAIGFQALSDISDAFVVKARGGTAEDGISWPPLSKKYLAYGRRFGKGEQAALKREAGLGPQHHRGVAGKGGLLNAQQQKLWNQVYARTIAWASMRFDAKTAQHIAAGHAWNVVKKSGGKTKLEVYGSRQVDILRDTGVLLNSLSPGYFDGMNYEKPTAEGGESQVFRPIADGIVVGTSVKYARNHNEGTTVPKRQFLPDTYPRVWLDRLVKVATQAIRIATQRQLGGQSA